MLEKKTYIEDRNIGIVLMRITNVLKQLASLDLLPKIAELLSSKKSEIYNSVPAMPTSR